MPVHNGEPHLRESIDSILGQSFHDFEFLIINDASTDHSRELVLSYRDPRIRLFDNEAKLGLTHSLNRGLLLAGGELIARQDADDISEPDRLARQGAFLQSNSETVLVGSWYKKIDEHNVELGARQLPCDWLGIRWALLFICPFVHSAVMFRRRAVTQEIGLYDKAFIYAQDYDLWSRIASRLPVANLPEYLMRYRMTPRSMTSTFGHVVQDETRRISIENLTAVIGSDEATRLVDAEADFANMSALVFGDYRRLSPAEAIAASRRISWLLRIFLRMLKDNSQNSQFSQFEAKLRSHLARRLIDIGNCRNDQAPRLVRQLALNACRLDWPQVFRWQLLRVLSNLMKRQLAGALLPAHRRRQ
jgi:glycosyltransferase involved in cell wall biosynthesis